MPSNKQKKINLSPKKLILGLLAGALVLGSFGLGYQAINNLTEQRNLATANSAPQPFGGCPYGTGTFGAIDCGLTTADIAVLALTCTPNPAAINTVTSCSFTLTANKVLPTDFRLSIGNGAVNAIDNYICPTYSNGGIGCPAPPTDQTCTLTGNTVTCNNVPTGNSVGVLPIYGNLGTGTTVTKTNTTSSINITGANMAKVTWNFTPDQGNTSPLFRSLDGTTINITNLKTNFDLSPTLNTRYTCRLEYRNLSDRLATTAWTSLSSTATTPSSTPNYITGTATGAGCTFSLTKAQRANNLNLSLRLTITDTLNTTPTTSNPNTFILYNEYIYRFLGAGIATGG